jgi:hypothetical protein
VKFSLFMLPCYREGVAPSMAQFYEELIEVVKLADATGWDRVWQSEHHFHYYGGAVPNPAVILTAWARDTKRIRLGPAISRYRCTTHCTSPKISPCSISFRAGAWILALGVVTAP